MPCEADTKGHCLRVHNPTPATSCAVQLKGPVTIVKNLVLSFDYRTEIEPGFEGAYLGMILYLAGWSDIERLEVSPDSHRFTTPAMPLESLASRARPRLLPVARLAEPNLTDARKKQLIKNAERLYQQGVPEHPGPHVPGDPYAL